MPRRYESLLAQTRKNILGTAVGNLKLEGGLQTIKLTFFVCDNLKTDEDSRAALTMNIPEKLFRSLKC